MAASNASLPVSAAQFAQAMAGLGPFEAAPHIAVALSGGSDSTALTLLAQEWAAGRGGRIAALTVDHALRPESAREARDTAQLCSQRRIPHHTLFWLHDTLGAGIQEKARQARYALLSDWCRNHGVLHLLTAHHLDDQCETLLLRLSRQSGLRGLAGMPALSTAQGVRLLRPLLAFPKSRLAQTALLHRASWQEDPGNAGRSHARARLRSDLVQAGFTPAQAARAGAVCTRLAAFRCELERHCISEWARGVRLYPEGYAEFEPALLSQDEPAALLISALLTRHRGEQPRGESVLRLVQTLRAGKPATLGGWRFTFQNERVLMTREPAACLHRLLLPPASAQTWDSRFLISHDYPAGLEVRALGATGAALLRRLKIRTPLPGAAMPTLPALWDIEGLLAAPHMTYRRPGRPKFNAQMRLRPVKPLAGERFSGLNDALDSARHLPRDMQQECA